LSESGIDIGRALTCDLCLEDPERVISGLHARIQARAGQIWLTDLSRNGTYLNGAPDPIPTRKPVELHDGDRIGIGPYEVVVLLGTSSSVPHAKPPGRQQEPRTEVLARFEPNPDPVGESPTAAWTRPKRPPAEGVSDTHVMVDPFGATAVLDATQAGLRPAETGSATTLIEGPAADATRSCPPGPPIPDDGATEAMPALAPTDALAVNAAIRAAWRALLELFDPAELERRFVGVRSSDLGLSVEDKARCWDGFKSTYARLLAETMQDRDTPERPS